MYIFHKTMANETIIELGFCDIRNNQGLDKFNQPPWTLITPDITKTSSNYCLQSQSGKQQ